jgi:transposase
MATVVLSDDLWAIIAPLLPPDPPKPKGGRPRLDDRRALNGVLFILKHGLGWQALPKELGFGSGMTCWRRWRTWVEAGVWPKLSQVLLDRLGRAEQIDWDRAHIDSSSVPAPRGAIKPGPRRPIGGNRAANTTCSSKTPASRSLRC